MIRPLALAAALLLAACSPAPLRPAERLDADARFVNAPPEALAEWPEAAWWRAFGSAELDALIAEARANNRDLRAAARRIAQSEAAARIAAAPQWPFLSLTGGTSRSRANTDTGATTRAVLRESISASLAASWEIDLWGRIRSAAEAGEARLLARRFDAEALALSISAETANAYFALLGSRERLAVAEQNLAAARRVLGLVQVRARAGAASDLEVAQQQAAVSGLAAQIEELRGQERRALDALALLLGRRPDQTAVSGRSLASLALPPILAGMPAGLLERRPDIARAEAELLAGGFDAAAARAARFPQLSLTVSGGQTSRELADFLSPERTVWSLAASLLSPLLQGGRLAAAEEQARARAEELAELWAASVLSAFRDAEDALAAAAAARRAHALRRAAFDSAARALALAEARWQAGAADFLSVLQAQQARLAAADALAQADLARFTSAVGLFRALGGGWSAPRGAALQRRLPLVHHGGRGRRPRRGWTRPPANARARSRATARPRRRPSACARTSCAACSTTSARAASPRASATGPWRWPTRCANASWTAG
ncbi:MAG: efflux transporter outer membrane subunit [Acetobacteraceae bacterium]|nr:efflux transporter outer membrane subunit [Acetobacteraceae bacterium]MDW8397293.1 efflux transporter outer membrane subunit [Acetobacteraceae bacterium]